MKDIEKKLENNKKWKKAEDNLKKFNEMMEIVKQYPIKLIIPIPSQQYEDNKKQNFY